MRFSLKSDLAPLVFCLLMVVPSSACAVTESQQRVSPHPNIVVILLDDLGWRDVQCYGGDTAETPNIDRLASAGMRFTQAYAPAPICSASRAAILTGKSPARLNFEFVTKWDNSPPIATQKLLPPPFTLDLPLSEVTLAELLKGSGYTTGCIGKWHVSRHHEIYLGYSPTHGPVHQGFDQAEEERGSHPSNYEERTFADIPEGEFPADQLTANAIRFLEENRSRPFFLYLSHYYVHTPVHTRAKWLFDKYSARLGPGVPERYAMYGAFVETMDHYVGRFLDALDRLGLAQDTLVILTSDNGGHPEYARNGPLRGSKWNLYEGGTRVPLIVRWPGRVDAGSVCEVPAIGTDLLPTICSVVGIQPPSQKLDGRSLLPLILGEEHSAPDWSDRELYWHFPYYHPENKDFSELKQTIGVNDGEISVTTPHSSIRKGNYKLLHFYEDDRYELYDLQDDPGEQQDLSSTLPDQTRLMKSMLEERLREAGARIPSVNPKYSETAKR